MQVELLHEGLHHRLRVLPGREDQQVAAPAVAHYLVQGSQGPDQPRHLAQLLGAGPEQLDRVLVALGQGVEQVGLGQLLDQQLLLQVELYASR